MKKIVSILKILLLALAFALPQTVLSQIDHVNRYDQIDKVVNPLVLRVANNTFVVSTIDGGNGRLDEILITKLDNSGVVLQEKKIEIGVIALVTSFILDKTSGELCLFGSKKTNMPGGQYWQAFSIVIDQNLNVNSNRSKEILLYGTGSDEDIFLNGVTCEIVDGTQYFYLFGSMRITSAPEEVGFISQINGSTFTPIFFEKIKGPGSNFFTVISDLLFPTNELGVFYYTGYSKNSKGIFRPIFGKYEVNSPSIYGYEYLPLAKDECSRAFLNEGSSVYGSKLVDNGQSIFLFCRTNFTQGSYTPVIELDPTNGVVLNARLFGFNSESFFVDAVNVDNRSVFLTFDGYGKSSFFGEFDLSSFSLSTIRDYYSTFSYNAIVPSYCSSHPQLCAYPGTVTLGNIPLRYYHFNNSYTWSYSNGNSSSDFSTVVPDDVEDPDISGLYYYGWNLYLGSLNSKSNCSYENFYVFLPCDLTWEKGEDNFVGTTYIGADRVLNFNILTSAFRGYDCSSTSSLKMLYENNDDFYGVFFNVYSLQVTERFVLNSSELNEELEKRNQFETGWVFKILE